MFSRPNPSNIKIWKRAVVWSMLALTYLIAALAAWAGFSDTANWWMFVAGASVGSFVVIYKLHALRENHRSSYAIIEIVVAAVVISLAIASGLSLLGMKISYVSEVSLIGVSAGAIYFGVRAWDKLYQSELRKGSKIGRWMELWIVEGPVGEAVPKKTTVYPWNRANGRMPD